MPILRTITAVKSHSPPQLESLLCGKSEGLIPDWRSTNVLLSSALIKALLFCVLTCGKGCCACSTSSHQPVQQDNPNHHQKNPPKQRKKKTQIPPKNQRKQKKTQKKWIQSVHFRSYWLSSEDQNFKKHEHLFSKYPFCLGWNVRLFCLIFS